jgi:hypothetical protein
MSLSDSRIDLFQQIKEFDYLCVSDSLPGITGNYRSVYFSLLSINNAKFWSKIFEVDFQYILELSKVDKDTYRRAMDFLNNAGLFDLYEKGINKYARAKISLKVLHEKSAGKTDSNAVSNAASSAVNMTVIKAGSNTTADTYSDAHFNKTITQTKKQETFIYELDFVDHEFLECFTRWLDYKKGRGEKYKTADSLRACYNKMIKDSGNNKETAEAMIENSIACNYAGMFLPKGNQPVTKTNKVVEILTENERAKQIFQNEQLNAA